MLRHWLNCWDRNVSIPCHQWFGWVEEVQEESNAKRITRWRFEARYDSRPIERQVCFIIRRLVRTGLSKITYIKPFICIGHKHIQQDNRR